MGRNASDESR